VFYNKFYRYAKLMTEMNENQEITQNEKLVLQDSKSTQPLNEKYAKLRIELYESQMILLSVKLVPLDMKLLRNLIEKK